MNYAIVLAGGSGTRTGADVPKQFVEVLGKPILAYTLETFQEHPDIDGIIVGCHPDWLEYMEEMIQKYAFTKVRWIATGGGTFQDTVINCMHRLEGEIQDDDLVLIQFGAAPFTKPIIIEDSIRVAKEKGNAIASTPCYLLLGEHKKTERIFRFIDRAQYNQAACPWTYRFGLLKELYAEGERRGIMDKVDAYPTALMEAMDYPIYHSYSDQTNVKITVKEDIELFEGWAMLQEKRKNEKK